MIEFFIWFFVITCVLCVAGPVYTIFFRYKETSNYKYSKDTEGNDIVEEINKNE